MWQGLCQWCTCTPLRRGWQHEDSGVQWQCWGQHGVPRAHGSRGCLVLRLWWQQGILWDFRCPDFPSIMGIFLCLTIATCLGLFLLLSFLLFFLFTCLVFPVGQVDNNVQGTWSHSFIKHLSIIFYICLRLFFKCILGNFETSMSLLLNSFIFMLVKEKFCHKHCIISRYFQHMKFNNYIYIIVKLEPPLHSTYRN